MGLQLDFELDLFEHKLTNFAPFASISFHALPTWIDSVLCLHFLSTYVHCFRIVRIVLGIVLNCNSPLSKLLIRNSNDFSLMIHKKLIISLFFFAEPKISTITTYLQYSLVSYVACWLCYPCRRFWKFWSTQKHRPLHTPRTNDTYKPYSTPYRGISMT